MTGASPRRTVSTSGSSGILPVGVSIGAHFAFLRNGLALPTGGPWRRFEPTKAPRLWQKTPPATILEQIRTLLRFKNATKQDLKGAFPKSAPFDKRRVRPAFA
jgi:hypothetical protein